MVAARGSVKEHGKSMFKRDRVSVLQDEKCSEMDDIQQRGLYSSACA